jgi:signal transduction histidine kinase
VTALLTVLVLGLLGGTLVLAAVAFAEFRGEIRSMTHTTDVKYEIEVLLASILQAETNERGYVLTGAPTYLEPYRAGQRDADEALAHLRAMIGDNTGQQRRLAEVERLVRTMLDTIRSGMAVRESEGLSAAATLIGLGDAEPTTDAIRADLAAMEDAEDLLLVERRSSSERDAVLTLAALTLASALFGLLLVGGLEQRRLGAERLRTAGFQEKLAAIVGHDLRNPLSAIVTNIQLLKRSANPSQTHALERMAASCARMGRMIDQLLDVARIRLGTGIAIAPTVVDLGKVVDDIADELRSSQPQGAIRIEKHDEVGYWDADRLGQVVSNLLGNALAYRAPDTPVVVTVRGDADHAFLTVHNDGPPIPAAVIPLLFDPFQRGQPSARPGSAGLGLGLYITKELVAAHGGSIDVQSTDNTGTTFTVSLPRRASVVRSDRTDWGSSF